MMVVTEEITYGKLFNRFPAWFVDYLASRHDEKPEMIHRTLFAFFLMEHLFICSVCGAEFEAADIDEAALVRCNNCRR